MMLAKLSPWEVRNLIGRTFYETEPVSGCESFWGDFMPLTKRVAAVVPNKIEHVELHLTPQGRRLFVKTRFGWYKMIPRRGRQWRVKKMRDLPPMPADAGELLPLSRML